MAIYHEANPGGYPGFGHGLAGHEEQAGEPDRDVDFRPGAADFGLCRADGAGLHSKTAGVGNRGGQGKRKTAGTRADNDAEEF